MLAYPIAPTESSYMSNELLQDVKAHGTEEQFLHEEALENS